MIQEVGESEREGEGQVLVLVEGKMRRRVALFWVVRSALGRFVPRS